MNKEIRHSFLMGASSDAITDALTQVEHIEKWWTKEARVEDGKILAGRSGYGWEVELEMVRDSATRNVVWHCTKSNLQNTNAWEGTTITFPLTPLAVGTQVDFAQTGYRASPCYEVCVQGREFLLGKSLKKYVETGKGIPYPEVLDTSQPPTPGNRDT